jgi:hypothetical protein
MSAVEAEAAGRLDSWLSDALGRVDQRLAAVEAREQAVSEREEKIRRAIEAAR